jgi:hypothetical protein
MHTHSFIFLILNHYIPSYDGSAQGASKTGNQKCAEQFEAGRRHFVTKTSTIRTMFLRKTQLSG